MGTVECLVIFVCLMGIFVSIWPKYIHLVSNVWSAQGTVSLERERGAVLETEVFITSGQRLILVGLVL